MKQPPFVVLIVVRTTTFEYDGTLSNGRRIYARCRDGAWSVRVAEKAGDDAISGTEIAGGTVEGKFGYHVLRRVTHGIVRWPRSLTVSMELSPPVLAGVTRGLVQAGLGMTHDRGSFAEFAEP